MIIHEFPNIVNYYFLRGGPIYVFSDTSKTYSNLFIIYIGIHFHYDYGASELKGSKYIIKKFM